MKAGYFSFRALGNVSITLSLTAEQVSFPVQRAAAGPFAEVTPQCHSNSPSVLQVCFLPVRRAADARVGCT